MADKLIPLSSIPYAAREREASERAKWPTRAMALDAASIEITLAPGCYGGAFAPRVGFVLTLDAARALAGVLTHMPGGSSHHRLAYNDGWSGSDALDEYIEAIARDGSAEGRARALTAYEVARRG